MIEALIEKYLNGACSEKEQQEIAQYFQKNPSELEAYFSEDQWNNYGHQPLTASTVSEDFLQNLLNDKVVRNKYNNVSNRQKPKMLRRIAVAAAVLMIAGFSYYFLNNTVRQKNLISETVLDHPNSDQIFMRANKGSTLVNIMLPDSSVVTLSPKSSISYNRKQEGKRDVYLEGEAVFKVHKDALHPFTVYCKEVATTALGTKFKVSALGKESMVSVILLEGKILVKSTLQGKLASKKYYLLPGNEINFNRDNQQFTFIENTDSQRAKPTDNNNNNIVLIDKEEAAVNTSGKIETDLNTKSVRFSDVSLSRVLDELASKRNILISYPTNRIANIKFIGTVKDSDPIEKILSDITSMNGLTLKKDSTANKYIIH